MNKCFKPCPRCRALIPRHNFRSVIAKCKRCLKLICPACNIEGLCHDCYVFEFNAAENERYFREKRIKNHEVQYEI